MYTDYKTIETELELNAHIGSRHIYAACEYTWHVKVYEDAGDWDTPPSGDFDVIKTEIANMVAYDADGESIDITDAEKKALGILFDALAINIEQATIETELW